MAWPLTAIRTYNFQAAPEIKADDLNKFQSAINGIINGSYTFKGLNLSTSAAGTSIATAATGAIWMHPSGDDSRFGVSTTLPSGISGNSKRIYPSKVIAAWATFTDSNGSISLKRGYRISNITRYIEGPDANNKFLLGYQITLDTISATDPTDYLPRLTYATLNGPSASPFFGKIFCTNRVIFNRTAYYIFKIQPDIQTDDTIYLPSTDYSLSVFFY